MVSPTTHSLPSRAPQRRRPGLTYQRWGAAVATAASQGGSLPAPPRRPGRRRSGSDRCVVDSVRKALRVCRAPLKCTSEDWSPFPPFGDVARGLPSFGRACGRREARCARGVRGCASRSLTCFAAIDVPRLRARQTRSDGPEDRVQTNALTSIPPEQSQTP